MTAQSGLQQMPPQTAFRALQSGSSNAHAIQKELDDGLYNDRGFLGPRPGPQSEEYLQVQIAPDHRDEMVRCSDAVCSLDFSAGPRFLEHLCKSRAGPARPLLIEPLHKLGKALVLGDDRPQNSKDLRRHVGLHQLGAKCGERAAQIVAVDLLDFQSSQRLVSTIGDDRREQVLLVAELTVDVPLGSTGSLDDRVDAGGCVALFQEHVGRRTKKRFASGVSR